MSKITLAKALKLKNIIIAEIAALQPKITMNKVKQNEFNHFAHINGTAYERSKKLSEQLIKLKSTIAIANASGDIPAKIYEVSELKSRIALLNTLDTDERQTRELQRGYDAEGKISVQTVITDWKCFLNHDHVAKEAKEARNRLLKLQEEMEKYNHETLVDAGYLDEEFTKI